MSTLSQQLYAQARIIPIQPQNRVKTVTKLSNGALRVEQHSGNVFEIAPEEEQFQMFLVYMMLNPNT